uniref:Uncharacterized protein n=1 Tax=Rhizophora mucronata TaxID=61149 RepID=A0A2P2IPB3_RHIMU
MYVSLAAWGRLNMLCSKTLSSDDGGSVPVHLNVYDLTPINGYAYWLGLGVYHSGVQGQCFFLFIFSYMVTEFSWVFELYSVLDHLRCIAS